VARQTGNKDITAVLEAAEQWIHSCLIIDGSVFSSDSLWSPEVVEEVRRAFVDHPNTSDDDFISKLKAQMKSASQNAQRLVAEMVWSLLLFPSNVKAATKRRHVQEMWALAGTPLPDSAPKLSDKVLNGIGSGGPGFNNYRPEELTFLIELTRNLKQKPMPTRQVIFDDYDAFMKWIDEVPREGDRQFRHMLRYFAFPDRVERISSNKDRRRILDAFGVSPFATTKEWTDRQLDDSLQRLRMKLEEETATRPLDFYEAPVRFQWLEDEDANSRNSTRHEDRESPRVPFDESSRKYFPIDRIMDCCRHLEQFHSSWVIPAFVLACNGVNRDYEVDLSERLGTDKFLDNFFNGALIGLPSFPSGNNTLRPRFKDLMSTFTQRHIEGDYVIQQDTKLWANAYSSRGYRAMRDRGEITGADRRFKLADKFQLALENNLPATFRFEELLVWLFAFKGVPREVNSWVDLNRHFLQTYTDGLSNFAPDFLSRFELSDSYPWPAELLPERPDNVDYRTQLMPSQIKFGDATSLIPDNDPIWLEVLQAIEDRGERNLLFFGPPATGKTWYAQRIARKLVGNDTSRLTVLQFHPAYSYDDFVEGYSPKLDANKGMVAYAPEKKHFLKMCEAAKESPEQRFVIVIDEISRGDPSRIFGDLLTYIEPTYRNVTFTLSYSGEKARIPDNLIIVGTVNPYDRSVAEMDDAFVRRFHMIEFRGDQNKLRLKLEEDGASSDLVNRILHFYSTVSAALPNGFGQAHFYGCSNREDVLARWNGRLKFLVSRALTLEPDRMEDINRTFDELFGQPGLTEQSDATS
jgi:5-methylcytosine-specific restriction protein B